MNASIAELLKARLQDLTYIGRLAGLVRGQSYDRQGTKITIPVALSVQDRVACDATPDLQDMVPNDGYASMVYFEDLGISKTTSRTRGITFTSRLRLVCWLNSGRLGGDATAGDKIAQVFITQLTHGPYNSGPYIGVRHRVDGMPVRGPGLFQGYTYPDSARQFLMPPFDAFAIDVSTEFRVRAGCEEEVLEQVEGCWTPPVIITPEPSDTTCRYLKVCGTPEVGDVATWDGTQWVPEAPTGGGWTPDETTNPGFLTLPSGGVIPILFL
jgi:hypothetical protein